MSGEKAGVSKRPLPPGKARLGRPEWASQRMTSPLIAPSASKTPPVARSRPSGEKAIVQTWPLFPCSVRISFPVCTSQILAVRSNPAVASPAIRRKGEPEDDLGVALERLLHASGPDVDQSHPEIDIRGGQQCAVG